MLVVVQVRQGAMGRDALTRKQEDGAIARDIEQVGHHRCSPVPAFGASGAGVTRCQVAVRTG